MAEGAGFAGPVGYFYRSGESFFSVIMTSSRHLYFLTLTCLQMFLHGLIIKSLSNIFFDIFVILAIAIGIHFEALTRRRNN